MGLRLNGSTSGSVQLNAPASTTSGADVVLTLPVNDGDASQYLQTDGAGALSWQTITTSDWTEATATSTSGSTVEFTGLPSDAKDIVVVWSGVSGTATSTLSYRLGTGTGPTYVTTGYLEWEGYYGSSTASSTKQTDQFRFSNVTNNLAHLYYGQVVLRNPTGNTWVTRGETWTSDATLLKVNFGNLALAAELTAIQFFFASGDFDAGNWKIIYRR